MEQFLETADVARARGVMPATVRADIAAGLLKVAAITKRGTRLFRAEDLAAYVKVREMRQPRRGKGEAA